MPLREAGRTPEREEGRGIPLAPVLLGGRGIGLALSCWESSNMLSILAAARNPLELPGRPRMVGRTSLIDGAWFGLEGDVGSALCRSDTKHIHMHTSHNEECRASSPASLKLGTVKALDLPV